MNVLNGIRRLLGLTPKRAPAAPLAQPPVSAEELLRAQEDIDYEIYEKSVRTADRSGCSDRDSKKRPRA